MREVAKHGPTFVGNADFADRRHFLKSSAAMIGAMALVGKTITKKVFIARAH